MELRKLYKFTGRREKFYTITKMRPVDQQWQKNAKIDTGKSIDIFLKLKHNENKLSYRFMEELPKKTH